MDLQDFLKQLSSTASDASTTRSYDDDDDDNDVKPDDDDDHNDGILESLSFSIELNQRALELLKQARGKGIRGVHALVLDLEEFLEQWEES